MKATNESLILKDRAELEAAPFFPNFDLPEIDKAKPRFHCTGERLFRDRKDVYEAVVKLLAEPGVSIREICRTLHVTDDTVRSVKERENISIAALKKGVLSKLTHGLHLASDRVIEMMPSASARDALLGVGILADKVQLLSGEATIRVEQTEREDIFASWAEFVRSLEVKNEASRTYLDGGNFPQTTLADESVAPVRDEMPDKWPQNALTDGSAALSHEVSQTEANGAAGPRQGAP
jgi:hypothetical protein